MKNQLRKELERKSSVICISEKCIKFLKENEFITTKILKTYTSNIRNGITTAHFVINASTGLVTARIDTLLTILRFKFAQKHAENGPFLTPKLPLNLGTYGDQLTERVIFHQTGQKNDFKKLNF